MTNQTTTQQSPTHGLAQKRPVLDVEDSDEFRAFANELLDQLDPTSPFEFYFAKRAVSQAWRIQRAQCYETLILDNLVKNCHPRAGGDPVTPAASDKTNPTETRRHEPSDVGADPCVCPNDKTNPISENENVRSCQNHDTQCSHAAFTCLEAHKTNPISYNSLLGQVLSDDFRFHRTLEKVVRYETRLECSMLRCLREFRLIRSSTSMNFSSLREYFRDFQPRPQDFQDTPTSEQNKANSVGADPCVCPNAQNKLTSPAGHPESPSASEGPADSDSSNVNAQNKANSVGADPRVCPNEQNKAKIKPGRLAALACEQGLLRVRR